VTYICGYCNGKSKAGRKRLNKLPPRRFTTFEDLIDHLVNVHRYKVVDNKLVRR
jgi:hypothetical protein